MFWECTYKNILYSNIKNIQMFDVIRVQNLTALLLLGDCDAPNNQQGGNMMKSLDVQTAVPEWCQSTPIIPTFHLLLKSAVLFRWAIISLCSIAAISPFFAFLTLRVSSWEWMRAVTRCLWAGYMSDRAHIPQQLENLKILLNLTLCYWT